MCSVDDTAPVDTLVDYADMYFAYFYKRIFEILKISSQILWTVCYTRKRSDL